MLKSPATCLSFLSFSGLLLLIIGAALHFGLAPDPSTQLMAKTLRLFEDYTANVSSLGNMLPASISYPYSTAHRMSETIPMVEEESVFSYSHEARDRSNSGEGALGMVISRSLKVVRELPRYPQWINVTLGLDLLPFSQTIIPETQNIFSMTCPFGYCRRDLLKRSCEGQNGIYEGGEVGCSATGASKSHCGICRSTQRLAELCIVVDAATMSPSTKYLSCRYPFGALDHIYQPYPDRSDFFTVEVVRSDDPRIVLQEATKGTMHFETQGARRREAAGLVCLALGAIFLFVGLTGAFVIRRKPCRSDSTDLELHPITGGSQIKSEVASSEARQHAYRLRMQHYRSQRHGIAFGIADQWPSQQLTSTAMDSHEVLPAAIDAYELNG